MILDYDAKWSYIWNRFSWICVSDLSYGQLNWLQRLLWEHNKEGHCYHNKRLHKLLFTDGIVPKVTNNMFASKYYVSTPSTVHQTKWCKPCHCCVVGTWEGLFTTELDWQLVWTTRLGPVVNFPSSPILIYPTISFSDKRGRGSMGVGGKRWWRGLAATCLQLQFKNSITSTSPSKHDAKDVSFVTANNLLSFLNLMSHFPDMYS